jgi:hypothetical protein
VTKIAESESVSGSIGQRHGSADSDPHQNVMDPEHCLLGYTGTCELTSDDPGRISEEVSGSCCDSRLGLDPVSVSYWAVSILCLL